MATVRREDNDVAQVERDAIVRRAQERLTRIDDRRAAYRLHQDGRTQREIATILHTTQPRVHRMLIAAEENDDTLTPEEVIVRATVDRTSRDELVNALANMPYSFTEYAPGVLDDGSKPGTWTQVSVANMNGMLSDEEYERVCDAVQPPSP